MDLTGPKHHHYLAGVLMLVVLLCQGSVATEADMALIPVVEPFLCAICHATADPVVERAELNPFGEDFLVAGRQWTSELAGADSDGDSCTNGVELGDADADGVADGNVTALQSNPGDGTDCGVNTVDATTWTELKGLFDRK